MDDFPFRAGCTYGYYIVCICCTAIAQDDGIIGRCRDVTAEDEGVRTDCIRRIGIADGIVIANSIRIIAVNRVRITKCTRVVPNHDMTDTDGDTIVSGYSAVLTDCNGIFPDRNRACPDSHSVCPGCKGVCPDCEGVFTDIR